MKPADLTPLKAVRQMRAAVDGLTVRYAAASVARGADTAPLLAVFAELSEATELGDYDRFAEVDRRLHMSILEVADEPSLTEICQTIFRLYDAFRVTTLRLLWPDLGALWEWHQRMVDAICAADQDEAEKVINDHFEASAYRMAEQTGDAPVTTAPLARACAYLAFHLHEPIQLDFLARRVAGTSPGNLARLFRQKFGFGFTEYSREIRLQKSLEMLARSRLSIGRIAAAVGYSDASRFTKYFRSRFGVTPRTYRKRFAQDLGPNR